jgi:hypothetical protein
MRNVDFFAIGILLGLLMAGVVLHSIKDSFLWAISHMDETI